jgi:hypothetical protein
MLLTCQHVVRDTSSGELAELIRCWPHDSGYNPDSKDRIWRATPASIQGLGDTGSGDFVEVGGIDWILLNVAKRGEVLDTVRIAPGLASAKWAVRQTFNPYRLIGYPDGMHTMHQDVVRASVSRDFRLSGTDFRTGQIVLTGSGSTAPGFSGGPYFDDRGRIVAIHRSFGAGKMPVAVDVDTVQTTLRDRRLQLVPQDQKWLWSWMIPRAIAVVVLAALVIIPMRIVNHYWQQSAPEPVTIYAIEGFPVARQLKTLPAVLADPIPDPEKVSLNDGVLKYTAGTFKSYDEDARQGFIATDRLNYRRQLWDLELPTAPITVKIRQHKKYQNIDALYKDLASLENDELKEWWEPETQPVLSILEIDASGIDETKPKIKVTQNQDTVTFIQTMNPDSNDPRRPKTITLKWHIGTHSPTKIYFAYPEIDENPDPDLPSPLTFAVRNFYIVFNPNTPNTIHGDDWVLHIRPALTVNGDVIPRAPL